MASKKQEIIRDILRDAKARISDELQTPIKEISFIFRVKVKRAPIIHQPYVIKLEALYSEVCAHWGKTLAELQAPCRVSENSCMRMVMWLVAKHRYPNIPLRYLGTVLKRADHTPVINGLHRAESLRSCEDPLFMYYYNHVKHYFHAIDNKAPLPA